MRTQAFWIQERLKELCIANPGATYKTMAMEFNHGALERAGFDMNAVPMDEAVKRERACHALFLLLLNLLELYEN